MTCNQPFDFFADALWQYHETGRADLRIERDDGYTSREDVAWYFTTPREFPSHEKAALRFARGRVLDVGCGAGRHALGLQKRGLRVTALDAAPRIAELARARGVKDVRVVDVCGARRLPFRDGEFDTIVLFGNNLGICGTLPRFRRMLRELHRIAAPRGRILATTRQPSTTNPRHRRYLRHNLTRGCAVGQIRLRLLFNGKRGAGASSRRKEGTNASQSSRRDDAPWFELLLLSPTDLMQVAAKEKWELAHVFPFENFEQGYAVVLEKSR
ncbi:MAG: class I SAM-dependent methyltransferase [Chloroflexota bacterium]|nr:class I SAM-dependent methyltransferase [Chloroflexota bacterium]